MIEEKYCIVRIACFFMIPWLSHWILDSRSDADKIGFVIQIWTDRVPQGTKSPLSEYLLVSTRHGVAITGDKQNNISRKE